MGWLWDSPEEKLQKALFDLKMAAKQLQRESKKCEKLEIKEKNLIKTCIEKNNTEGARIHAENSIRNHNQALQYLKMSARVEAVASRVQTAVSTQNVTKNMVGVCRTMEGVMNSMNLEKISEMMDRFEHQFENLDVQMDVMDNTMQGTSAQFTPEDSVQKLMQEQADLAGIQLNMELPEANREQPQATGQIGNAEDQALQDRLRALRDET